jgi:hypothetical protein
MSCGHPPAEAALLQQLVPVQGITQRIKPLQGSPAGVVAPLQPEMQAGPVKERVYQYDETPFIDILSN